MVPQFQWMITKNGGYPLCSDPNRRIATFTVQNSLPKFWPREKPEAQEGKAVAASGIVLFKGGRSLSPDGLDPKKWC